MEDYRIMDFNLKQHLGKLEVGKFKKSGFAVLIGLMLVMAMSLVYAQDQITKQNESYDTYANVSSADGQNLSVGIESGRELSYGKLVEGTNMTKTLQLSSDRLTLAEVSSEGNISGGLEYEDQLFVNDTEIPVKYVGSEPGYYEGEILLDLKTAQNWWGEKWLELLYQLP